MLLVTSRRGTGDRLTGRYLAVPPRRAAAFTAIQLIALAIIFGVTYTPGDIIFPILIVLLVPLRLYILPRLFSPADLALLDEAVPRPLHAAGPAGSSRARGADGAAGLAPSTVTQLDLDGPDDPTTLDVELDERTRLSPDLD